MNEERPAAKEEKIKIAYLLLVHKNPSQVNSFMRQISREGSSDIFIHVDKKSPVAVVDGIIAGPNVQILRERINVNWGDINMVNAILLLLRKLRDSRKKYDFVCLNSGQDLLVKKGLADYLTQNKSKIFMKVQKVGQGDPMSYFIKIRWPKITRDIYDSAFHPYRILRYALMKFYAMGLNLRPNQNELPKNYDFYRGSTWFCIPGAVADYVVEFLDQTPAFYEAFKDALVADESFFQTLIMNSPYRANVVDENLTYLNFGKTFRDHNHAVTLTMKDVPQIDKSGMFFARKFDEAVDGRVIEYYCAKF